MLALAAPLWYDDDEQLPDCLPSCEQYGLRWNDGFGCSSQFEWWTFPTPAECRERRKRALQAKDEGMDDDDEEDVIIVKQEEYNEHVSQQQQRQQRWQQAATGEWEGRGQQHHRREGSGEGGH